MGVRSFTGPGVGLGEQITCCYSKTTQFCGSDLGCLSTGVGVGCGFGVGWGFGGMHVLIAALVLLDPWNAIQVAYLYV